MNATTSVAAEHWRELTDEALIAAVLAEPPVGRAAVVTSFGIESAVLLDMVARVDRAAPVFFVDTGKLFDETIAYRDQLIDRLALDNVKTILASPEKVRAHDPEGSLYQTDPDACCRVRKVEPYAHQLAGFDFVISGRKRFQGGERSLLETVQMEGGQVKINPMAHWTEAQIDDAFDQRGLPRHPLFFDGYDSVGCAACSHRRPAGTDARAGRWKNSDKTECGIHSALTDRADAA